MTQRTDARGLKTLYFYDNADRNTSIEHRTAANALVDTISYTYDAANRRTTMVDPVGTTTYAYDNADRLSSATFPGSPTKTVSYLYDAAGNRTRLTYPDTKQVNYAYDVVNRTSTVTDWVPAVTTYAYDDAGRLTSTTYRRGRDQRLQQRGPADERDQCQRRRHVLQLHVHARRGGQPHAGGGDRRGRGHPQLHP
jgi:YD repeat-containing protein